jgi:hypothetical protein
VSFVVHLCVRALLRKPALLLCDEVTSSVDAAAEREITDAIFGRTSAPTTTAKRVESGAGGGSSSSVGGGGGGGSFSSLAPSGGQGTVPQIPTRHSGFSLDLGKGQIAALGGSSSLHNREGAQSKEQEGQERKRGRTTITVAHRLSSIVQCDRIIVLQQGAVAEEGTHRELLAIPNGVYRKMWEIQNGGVSCSSYNHGDSGADKVPAAGDGATNGGNTGSTEEACRQHGELEAEAEEDDDDQEHGEEGQDDEVNRGAMYDNEYSDSNCSTMAHVN